MCIRDRDVDYNFQTVTAVLTGTTPVAVPGIWMRITSIDNSTGIAGSAEPVAKESVGNVSLNLSGGTPTYLVAIPEKQGASSSAFTIPAGFTGFLKQVVYTVNKTGGTDAAGAFKFYTRQQGGVWVQAPSVSALSTATSIIDLTLSVPFAIPEKTDVRVTAFAFSQTVDVTADNLLVLIDNKEIA